MCADIGDILSVSHAFRVRDGSGHRALEDNATGEENRAQDFHASVRSDPITWPAERCALSRLVFFDSRRERETNHEKGSSPKSSMMARSRR
jgi:hypothetical protein